MRGGRAGARFGVLVGFTSWAVVLGAICIGTGRTQYLWPVILPVLLASLGLGLLALCAIEPALPGAPPPRDRVRRVLGAVGVGIGLLLLLADGLVVPMLEADRALGDVVRSSGGVLGVPRWSATLALVAGCALLARSLWRPREQPPGPPPAA